MLSFSLPSVRAHSSQSLGRRRSLFRMSATSAPSSPVDKVSNEEEEEEEESFSGPAGARSEGLASGVCGGVVVVGSSASKSERSRPRGRVGGQVRWRLGVDGRDSEVVSWSREGPASSLKERRRLRLLLRGGVRGCDLAILAFCTGCGLGFFGWARGPEVRTMGLPRWGGARMNLGLGERAGRLLARRDCSARQVLYLLEVGDWQTDDGGESIVVADV